MMRKRYGDLNENVESRAEGLTATRNAVRLLRRGTGRRRHRKPELTGFAEKSKKQTDDYDAGYLAFLNEQAGIFCGKAGRGRAPPGLRFVAASAARGFIGKSTTEAELRK